MNNPKRFDPETIGENVEDYRELSEILKMISNLKVSKDSVGEKHSIIKEVMLMQRKFSMRSGPTNYPNQK